MAYLKRASLVSEKKLQDFRGSLQIKIPMKKKYLRQLMVQRNFWVFLIPLIVLFFWFAFEELFLRLLIKKVIPFFNYFELPVFLEALLFVFFAGFILFQILKIVNGYIEHQKILWIQLPLLIIYSNYRFAANVFDFFRFSFLNEIAYFDILLFQLFFVIISLSRYTIKSPFIYGSKIDSNQLIVEDEPWVKGKSDKLNRLKAAKALSKEICGREKSNSYAYGVVGGWGDGKTSFLNMVEYSLKDEEGVIIIHFNPWKSSSPKSIQKDYFLTLKTGLRFYSSEVLPAIDSYLKSLLNLTNTRLTNFLEDAMLKESDLLSKYDEVNTAIKRINKKIIIIIDDIDRLDSNEIIEIIKIIRNSANFSNTIFIAAYDKGYLNNAIRAFSEYKHSLFVEKIFQHEIFLPTYPSIILENELKKILKESFPGNISLHQEIDSTIKFTSNEIQYIPPGVIDSSFDIEKIITSLRDVKRIAISFINSYSPIREDVAFQDMFYLVLLKVKFYEVFIELPLKKFLTSNGKNFNFLLFDEEKFDNTFKEKEYNDLALAKGILKILFPEEVNTSNTLKISYINSFPLYFTNQLFEKLSRGTFKKALEGRKEEIKQSVYNWVQNNYQQDIFEYLGDININSLASIIEFENYLEIQFELINHNKMDNIHGLIHNFENPRKQEVADLFYKGEQLKVEKILTDKLKNALYPFRTRIIVRELIGNYFYERDGYAFFISKKELQNTAVGYLKRYLNQSDDLDNDGMWLYYSCIHYIDNEHKIHLLDDANEMMKKFIINKNHNYYLDNFIVKYSVPDVGFRKGEAFVESIFGSYNDFEDFIYDENIEYHNINELRRFYKEYKKNNYRPIKWKG